MQRQCMEVSSFWCPHKVPQQHTLSVAMCCAWLSSSSGMCLTQVCYPGHWPSSPNISRGVISGKWGQWCQLHSGKPTGSVNSTAGCQIHRLLLGTILKMLNGLTCHITHSADSMMTFPLTTAFAVCFKVDKAAVLHEFYIGSVTNIPRPFPLHRAYWTWTLILWILPGAEQQAFLLPRACGEGKIFLCQGTRLEVMARQLSPELMKVHLIASSAAKLLWTWSKSKAWNRHMSLKEAHLQAEDCRGGN